VSGDVDDVTSRGIGQSLTAESRHVGCRGLVIDLRSVTFLGSTGLSMLIDVRRGLTDQGADIILLCDPSSMALRVLQITRLDECFAITTALRDAFASLDGDPDLTT
jgi:anti-sigma B factor antagonist